MIGSQVMGQLVGHCFQGIVLLFSININFLYNLFIEFFNNKLQYNILLYSIQYEARAKAKRI